MGQSLNVENGGTDTPRKMTQNEIRSQATRARILDAACKQFVTNGLDGTRMEAIAADAGVNKSLVYRHFGDRETLFREVLRKSYQEVRRSEAELVMPSDPLAALDTIVAFTLRYYIEHPEFHLLIAIENLKEAVHLREFTQEELHVPSLVGILGKLILRGTSCGKFREGLDPADLFMVICSQCWFTVATPHTYGHTFGTDVLSDENIARREALIQDTVRRWVLRHPADVPADQVSGARAG